MHGSVAITAAYRLGDQTRKGRTPMKPDPEETRRYPKNSTPPTIASMYGDLELVRQLAEEAYDDGVKELVETMYAVLEELPPASGALDAVLRRRWQDTADELNTGT